MSAPDLRPVRDYVCELQDRICGALEEADAEQRFERPEVEAPGGGIARPAVLEQGSVIEKAAVQVTCSAGPKLPPAATERRPELVGRSFEAASLSLIVHPRNPYVPTTHMNVRAFAAHQPGRDSVWWFGGGFDLTPYYGFEEDAVHWHRTARDACAPFGDGLYEALKKRCDEYFFLTHRDEARGIGGIFYDDFAERDFDFSFAFMRSVGDHFLPAYQPILLRRAETPWGDRERDFQLYRRGRYAEFNLVQDRGTRYGLQSGRRIESVLASLPPLVRWRHDWHPAPGSPEARLYTDFLPPRDWLAGSAPAPAP